MRKSISMTLTLVLLGFVTGLATAQLRNDGTQATVVTNGPVTVLTVPSTEAQTAAGIDYVNAQPMELPSVAGRSDAEAVADLIHTLTSPPLLGTPGHSPGERGDGTTKMIRLGAPPAASGVISEEFGTNNHPFSTARADLSPTATNKSYPYRAAGKLFFNIGTSTFLCSASLIKRGVVVTAAHCVSKFGQKQFYSNWHFVPGYRNGSAPVGNWTVKSAFVLTAYLNGTDPLR